MGITMKEKNQSKQKVGSQFSQFLEVETSELFENYSDVYSPMRLNAELEKRHKESSGAVLKPLPIICVNPRAMH